MTSRAVDWGGPVTMRTVRCLLSSHTGSAGVLGTNLAAGAAGPGGWPEQACPAGEVGGRERDAPAAESLSRERDSRLCAERGWGYAIVPALV